MSLRRRLPPKSPTTMLPAESTATPRGLLNRAAAPKPFADPAAAAPARVVTTPEGVTARMRWLFLSATMTSPE